MHCPRRSHIAPHLQRGGRHAREGRLAGGAQAFQQLQVVAIRVSRGVGAGRHGAGRRRHARRNGDALVPPPPRRRCGGVRHRRPLCRCCTCKRCIRTLFSTGMMSASTTHTSHHAWCVARSGAEGISNIRGRLLQSAHRRPTCCWRWRRDGCTVGLRFHRGGRICRRRVLACGRVRRCVC